MATRDETIRFLIETLGNENLVALTRSIKDAGSAGKEAEPEVRALTTELNTLLDQQKGVDSLIGLKASFNETGIAIGQAKTHVDDLTASFGAAGPATAKQRAELAAANAVVADLTAKHQALGIQVTTVSNTLAKSGVDVGNLAVAHTKLSGEAATVARSLENVVTTAGNGGGVIAGLKTHFEGFGESLKKGGELALDFGKKLLEITGIAGLVATGLAALTGEKIFEEGIKGAAEFETSITKAGIAVNASKEELEKLGTAAEQAAEVTHTSGEAAAAALAILAQGAGGADKAISELVPTLLLARAAQIDAAEAAGILGTTIAEFGLQATDATRVADLLAKTAGIAKVDIADLSNGFAKVAPDAKAAGVSVEETAALFAALSDSGIRGKKATTELTEVFKQMADPTSKLRGELLAFGLSGESLSTVLTKVRGNADQTRQIIEALGSKGGSAFRALLNAVPDLQRLNTELGHSAGAAQEAADKYGNTLSGAFQHFKDVFGEAAVSLSKPLLEPLTKQFNIAATAVGEFIKSANFAKIRDSILDFVNGAITGIGNFVNSFGGLDELSTKVADFVRGAGESFKSFGEGMSVAGRIATGTVSTISAAFNGLYSIIAGISAGAVTTIALATKAYEGLRAIQGASKLELDAIDASYQNLKQTANDIGEKAQQAFDKAAKNLSGVADAINGTKEATAAAAPAVGAHAEALGKTGEAAKGAKEEHEKLSAALANLPQGLHQATQAEIEHAKAAAEAKRRTEDLETAFKNLGITSQRDLKDAADKAKGFFETIDRNSANTAAGLADRQEAFLAYAAKALAASKNLDQGAQESTRIQLESKASTLNVSDALKQLEDSARGVVDAQHQLGQQTADNAGELDEAAKAAHRYADALERLRGGTGGNVDAQKELDIATKNAGNSTEKQAAQAEGARKVMQQSEGAASSLAQVTANVAAGYDAISKAAGDTFRSTLDRALQNIGLTKFATEDLTKSVSQLNAASADTAGFVAYFRALASAQKTAQDAIDSARASLKAQVQNFEAFSNSAGSSLDNVNGKLGLSVSQLEAMAQRLKEGTYDAGVLGNQELGPLQAAVDAAIARVKALKDAAKAASDQFESLAQSVHDALLQEVGDQKTLEDERHQKQLDNLKAEAIAAGQQNSAAYQKAIAEENQLHDLKMKNIAQQNAAQNGNGASGTSSSGSSAPSSPQSNSNGGGAAAAPGGGGFAPLQQLQPVHVHIGDGVAQLAGTQQQVANFLDLIQRARINSI